MPGYRGHLEPWGMNMEGEIRCDGLALVPASLQVQCWLNLMPVRMRSILTIYWLSTLKVNLSGMGNCQ